MIIGLLICAYLIVAIWVAFVFLIYLYSFCAFIYIPFIRDSLIQKLFFPLPTRLMPHLS